MRSLWLGEVVKTGPRNFDFRGEKEATFQPPPLFFVVDVVPLLIPSLELSGF